MHLTADNPPLYEALSYTWGSADNSVEIKVASSKTITVTQNLANALPYLRYADRPRFLWIDAICIDQQNLKERGHQVERMADIYRLADRVVPWLGLEENDSTYALEIMRDLSSTIEVDWLARTMRPASH